MIGIKIAYSPKNNFHQSTNRYLKILFVIIFLKFFLCAMNRCSKLNTGRIVLTAAFVSRDTEFDFQKKFWLILDQDKVFTVVRNPL